MRDFSTKVANNNATPEGRLTANEDNVRFRELENIVSSSGIALNPALGPDTDQAMISQAVARYASGGVYCQDGGAADAYLLSGVSGFVMPKEYFDGMQLIFRPGAANTGPAAVNAFGIGLKPIYNFDGSVLSGGEIVKNIYTLFIYSSVANLGNGGFLILPWAKQPINGISGLSSCELVAYIRDRKAAGTGGGVFTEDSWRTRDLNHVAYNKYNLVSLSNNRVTIPIGEWVIAWSAPFGVYGSHVTRLYDITNSSELEQGNSAWQNNTPNSGVATAQTNSFGQARLSVVSPIEVEIQHYYHTDAGETPVHPDEGFGMSGATVGSYAYYAEMKIYKG